MLTKKVCKSLYILEIILLRINTQYKGSQQEKINFEFSPATHSENYPPTFSDWRDRDLSEFSSMKKPSVDEAIALIKSPVEMVELDELKEIFEDEYCKVLKKGNGKIILKDKTLQGIIEQIAKFYAGSEVSNLYPVLIAALKRTPSKKLGIVGSNKGYSFKPTSIKSKNFLDEYNIKFNDTRVLSVTRPRKYDCLSGSYSGRQVLFPNNI